MSNLLKKRFRYTYFKATFLIVAINVLMYLLSNLYGHFHELFSMNPVLVIRYKYFWQPFTCMFMHANWNHLFFNMIGLLIFGINIEKSMGSKEFVMFYLLCGFLANILSLVVYLITNQYFVFLLGASGAVYAVLLAFATIFPRVRIFVFGIIPVPAPVLIILYTIIELFSSFSTRSNVAHFTHLFGFLTSYLYFVIRVGVNPIKIWKNSLK